MKTVLTFALLLSASVAAEAGVSISTRCNGGFGSASCRTIIQEHAPVIDTRTAEERDEIRRKWEAFCRPVLTTDSLGVGRYVYAHKGCEFGRSE